MTWHRCSDRLHGDVKAALARVEVAQLEASANRCRPG